MSPSTQGCTRQPRRTIIRQSMSMKYRLQTRTPDVALHTGLHETAPTNNHQAVHVHEVPSPNKDTRCRPAHRAARDSPDEQSSGSPCPWSTVSKQGHQMSPCTQGCTRQPRRTIIRQFMSMKYRLQTRTPDVALHTGLHETAPTNNHEAVHVHEVPWESALKAGTPVQAAFRDCEHGRLSYPEEVPNRGRRITCPACAACLLAVLARRAIPARPLLAWIAVSSGQRDVAAPRDRHQRHDYAWCKHITRVVPGLNAHFVLPVVRWNGLLRILNKGIGSVSTLIRSYNNLSQRTKVLRSELHTKLTTRRRDELGHGLMLLSRDAQNELALIILNILRGRGGWAVRLLACHPRRTRFSHVGIVTGDAAGRWFFLGICRFPHPCVPMLIHYHLISPSSDQKTAPTDPTTTESSVKIRCNYLAERAGHPSCCTTWTASCPV
ncbi:hypothetical protein PR048_028715 [Dryococelus australis]|uniref:Uncharacterized protein n=1 Tax=Dryococelus australis TaxID=614101 RepID=A0ABQ9GBD1_9NEOP|nr:hypothetical protein PR048_028715 [Dryococelus australis]